MSNSKPDTDGLLERSVLGDKAAAGELFQRHSPRLKRMIALRMDCRMSARIDPSDVLQETLAEAARQLAEYHRHRPLPFYPWLRQIAWQRLTMLYRQHIQSQRRSVEREEPQSPPLPDQSAWSLAKRLIAREGQPSTMARQKEESAQVREALARLAERDREILVLRHLEQLGTAEIAAVLAISEGAVYTRHLRALERLRRLLEAEGEHKA